MNKTDLLFGFLIGIFASLLGSFLFIKIFTDFDFITGVQMMKSQGSLGKLITLGSILDLIIFAVLLKLNKEMMARGILLAVILIAILTLVL
ncbi:MAG TPA: hypothetical protein VIH09_09835 [Flavobacterium sp.]|uniref:hypothetical protein n=1 Tax=Flavobacterium sp. TaxID=239 RepID=UPI002F3FA61E